MVPIACFKIDNVSAMLLILDFLSSLDKRFPVGHTLIVHVLTTQVYTTEKVCGGNNNVLMI